MSPRVACLVLLSLAGGCASVDVRIRNPIAARCIDHNRLTKTHEWAERDRGLPAGVLTDRATLIVLDEQQVCFDVQLAEMAALDPQGIKAEMHAPGYDPMKNPQVTLSAPGMQTFSGRIPRSEVVGMQTYCHYYRGRYCIDWRTRPVYNTVYYPGPVNVYTATARLCFPNGGMVTRETERLTLDLSTHVLSNDPAYVGAGGFFGGGRHKEATFRWGFVR